MKFICQREQLDKQLQQIGRIITVRQSMPILSNILLETDKNILRISGTDLELAMTTYLAAEIKQEGIFTVPAKIFQEFVHQNPDGEIEFSLESFELVCRSAKVTGRIAGIDSDEYPALPKMEKGQRYKLPLQEFVEATKKVIIACAVDQTRPVLTGIYVQMQEDEAVLAATDSFRLVEKKIKIVPVPGPVNFLIPSRTIQEIIRVAGNLSSAITDFEMEVNEQQLIFRIGEVELYSRLLVGAFPKYQNIIPTKSVAIVGITTPEMVQALRLSYVFSQSGVANVLLEIDEEGVLSISSHGSQKGSTKHTIYAIVEKGFQPIKVPFNAKFLLDACAASGSDHLQLNFSGTTSPLVIRTEDDAYLQLVMPIRLDS